MSKFNYSKAEADLYEVGARHPEEVYEYKSEKALRSHMKEYGLNPDKYYKADKKSGSSRSGSQGGNNTGGCYLTSACVNAKGLPDDCKELQILRTFRDGYLMHQIGGKEEIGQYYEIAPKIVESINQKPGSVFIWNKVFEELVSPCVRLIQNGHNEEAHQLYKAYSLKLCEQYC